MCLNHNFEKSAGFGGWVDHVFKPQIFEVDHVFKPSLAYTYQKGLFLQKEAFPKKR